MSFPVMRWLTSVPLDIKVRFSKRKKGVRLHCREMLRLKKLTEIKFRRRITEAHLPTVSTEYWIFKYGVTKRMLSENWSHVLDHYSQKMCMGLGVNSGLEVT